MDKLRLANAKLQSDPGNAALKLMDCVQEMVNGNPSGVTKSKDDDRKKHWMQKRCNLLMLCLLRVSVLFYHGCIAYVLDNVGGHCPLYLYPQE